MNKHIIKLANSCARRARCGWPTQVIFDDVPEPTVVRHVRGGYVKNSDGTPVSNAYRRKGWSSCHYRPAQTTVAIPHRYQLLPDN